MHLSAFDKNRIIDEHDVMVFDQPCNYDIILGRDFLRKVGMNLNYKDLSIKWLGNTAPWIVLTHLKWYLAKKVESYLYQTDLEDEGEYCSHLNT